MSAETDRGLTHPKRFITAHDETGKAVFSSSIPEPVEFEQIPNDAIFSLCYATNTTPVNLGSNNDIKTYNQYLNKKPGVMIPGGSVLRMVDMPPGATSPMHRTTSLDYGVVLAGNVELILDSGEVRAMRVGDMSVQRGTMHAWRNMSKTEWARMLYILLEAEPLELAGKVLGEDYGGGHSWAAWSVRDNAILIDLGKYKLMELYDSNNMVKVSPSTTGQTLNTYLATVGKWFGGGHVPTVGLGGFLLQGGMGWNCANWGWACEKVKAVDVVTSDGRELHCTETENSELLWAARGAGPGFPAIVTAFHLELRDVYKVMRAATFQWPMSEYERIMEWTLKACRECDETIEAVAVALFVEGRTEPVIMSHFLTFQQTEEAAKAALHHISSTRPDGAIMEKPFEPTGLFEEYAAQLVANPEKHRYFCDNAYINNDSNVVEVLRDSFETLPRNTKSFSLYYHMGRTSERQLPDMALSMETDHYFASYTITESDEDDARCRSWLSNIMGSMERESAGAYLGDSDFQARRTKFWGDAQGKKLMDIRRKWDPKGVVCGYLDVEDKSGPAGLENVHEWQSKL